MTDLDEQLHRLAETVALPVGTPLEDLARGRARRRTRDLAVICISVAATAVVATGLAFATGNGRGNGAAPGFAGGSTTTTQAHGRTAGASHHSKASEVMKYQRVGKNDGSTVMSPADVRLIRDTLDGYRDTLRADLDPAGTRIQTARITDVQLGSGSLGTKLDWNSGGMLEIGVGHGLAALQFFCDGTCEQRGVPGATKALVQIADGRISVAVFQDDGDIVVLDADVSFGNNGTTASSLGLTADQLLAAAADPRLDVPDPLPQGELPVSFFG